jgi:serine/threonine protein kinase
MQHLHSEPPSPWDFNPGLPARAVAVVMRCLEKDPNRRYRDAAELAAALREQTPTTSAGTTMLHPIADDLSADRTTVMRPTVPVVPPTVVERAAPRTIPPPSPNMWRRTFIALAILLVAAAAAGAAYFATQNGFGMGTTAAATATPTATPKPHHKATPVPTQPLIIATRPPAPTDTPVPLPPATNTPTAVPPPTKTPVPATDTPVPLPPATSTPQPEPTFTFFGPTPTSTGIG